jgi:glutaminase
VHLWSSQKWTHLRVARYGVAPCVFLCVCVPSTLQPLAIAHFMKGMECFPQRMHSPTDVAQLYFQSCAIEVGVKRLAVAAATFAAAGVCPITGSEVLLPDTVRLVLAHLYACGMRTVRAGWRAVVVGFWHACAVVASRRHLRHTCRLDASPRHLVS